MILEILKKKRDKQTLNAKEIDFFVNGVVEKTIPDYQISALCMAIYLNGMTEEETINLTKSYVKYSYTFNWGKIKNKLIDKHSTGGVGDKVSIAVIPIWVACGLKIVKFSGRGLGFTGGTPDKLESISGFNCDFTNEQIVNLVKTKSCVLAESNFEIAPGDKIIYAIRDVTNTVESTPLIAASIMSKKIASGSKNLIIDLKIGSGSLNKTTQEANDLAHLMLQIAKSFNINIKIVMSSMDEPLGIAIGNALEIKETYDILDNKGPKKITNFIIDFAAHGLTLVDKSLSFNEAKSKIKNVLDSKKALSCFQEIIKTQGGDYKQILEESFIKPKHFIKVLAKKSGYVKKMHVSNIGEVAKLLGAGRIYKDDLIDFKAGIYAFVKVGDFVKEGDCIFKMQSSKKISQNLINKLQTTIEITKQKAQTIDKIKLIKT